MKAISPMIAVVLLIAFTVAVGGILSAWMSSLAISQTTTVSSGTEKQVKCSSSLISIVEVRYPSGTGRGFVNVTVRYDSGTEVLSNYTAEVSARGSLQGNASTGIVTPGEARTVSVSPANFPPELVSVRALCRDTVPIVGECKVNDPCMKPAS